MGNLTKELWLEKCAARFVEVAGLDAKTAMESAVLCLEGIASDLAEDPQIAADEELSIWTD